MKCNYSKLIGRIIERYGKRAAFAKAMSLSEHSLSMKLNSKISFKQEEVIKACRPLDIAVADIPAYFFVLEVQAGELSEVR